MKYHLIGVSLSYSLSQNCQRVWIFFLSSWRGGEGGEGTLTLKADNIWIKWFLRIRYLHVEIAGARGSVHGCDSAQEKHKGTFLVFVFDMADRPNPSQARLTITERKYSSIQSTRLNRCLLTTRFGPRGPSSGIKKLHKRQRFIYMIQRSTKI